MRKVLIPLLLAIMLLPAVVQAQLTLPYTTGFEGLTTGQLPTGWSQLQSGSSGSGTFPAVYQYANNARNGSVYFEFESTTGQTELAALPVVSDVSQLQLSFYASVMNHNFLFEVGVMDSTTFEPVDTIALTVGSGGNWHGSYNQYTVYFNNYTGSGNRMAMRVTSSGSYTLMIDDLEIDYIPTCPAPTNLVVDSAGVDWLALSWHENGTAASWVVEYDVNPIPDSLHGTNIATTVNVSGTPSTTLTGLDTSTTYYIYVLANCGEYSRAVSLTASTLVGLPATVPYFCDFEQSGTNGWNLINGTQTNQWFVDSATNNGGSRSLYISNNNGTSNEYTNSSTTYVFAERAITLSLAGEYTYSYDWKANGESSYDFIRVAIVPLTTELTAGDYSGFNNSSAVPAGGIAIDGAYRLNGQSSWQTQSGVFNITTPGTYKIVFLWRNDGSAGNNPPAAIDNVAISRNTCPAPYGLVASDVQPTEVTLTWHAGGMESAWEITYGGVPEAAFDTTYTIYGLTPDTTYHFVLRAVCDVDDTSLPVSITVTTPPTCTTPTGRSIAGTGSSWVTLIWNGVANATSYQIAYGASGFTPDDNTAIDVYDTTYTITDLSNDTLYSVYVRSNCDGGEYSAWSSFGSVMPGAYLMTQTVDTLRVCGVTLFDNGGPTGDYSGNNDNTLVLISPSPDSTLNLWGTLNCESNWDHLYIYDGIGTSGEEIYHGSGMNLSVGPFVSNSGAFTIHFTADGIINYAGFELHTNCVYMSDCTAPVSISADSVHGDTAWVSWIDTTSAGSYQLAYGLSGFNPDTATDNIIYVYGDTSYMITGLTMGQVYDLYVRADCGSEQSMWRGPVIARPGYNYIMPITGSDVIRGCGYVIYDNGGPDGNYDNYCDATVTVYPSSPDSLFQLWGTFTGEGCCDYLYIYDGTSTSGTQLFYDHCPSSGSTMNIGPYTSTTGAFTIRFTSDVSGTYAGLELHTACMAPPECADVLDVAVMPGVTTAFVSWNEGLFGTYNGATVEYQVVGDSTWTLGFTTTETYGALTGLDTLTAYNVRVTANCTGGDASPVSAMFTTNTYPCAVVDTTNSYFDTIGNGTTNTYNIPVNNYYRNTFSEQLYDASDLGSAGSITGISFQYAYSTASTKKTNCTIYLANTTRISIDNSNYIAPEDMTMVYTGAMNCTTGWNHFVFNERTFSYTGGNLAVAVVDNSNDYDGSSYYFYAHFASGKAMSWYNDSYSYPSSSMNKTNHSYRNNVIFDFQTCTQTSTCPAPVASVVETAPYSVTVAWAPGDVETSWNLSYRRVGDTAFTSAGSTSTPTHTFTGLFASTEYEFKVAASCAGPNDGSVIVTAFTECGPAPLPYTEDFENQSGLYSRNCWYTGTTNLGTSYPNPIVVNLEGNPNKLLLLYNGAYVILPEMDAPLNQLQIRFNFVQGGNNVRLIMGVMADPTAPIDSIHVIDTLIRSNYDTSAYAYVVYPLDGISDTAGHLAFWDAFNDNYSFLDNIVVEYIPNCTNVSDVVASNVTTNSATISWTGSTFATSYLVEYGYRGFTPGTGTTVTSATTSVSLTGLDNSTSYQVYVYAVCTGDTSIASQVCNFVTSCGAITNLPYVQNFENILGPGDNSANVVPNCWASALLPEGAGHEVPHVFYNTDLGHAPSPQYCFYFEGIGIAALPEMGVPLDSLMISFHEWNSNPSNYGLIIGAVDNTDSGFASSFQPIDTIPFGGTGNQFDVVSMLNGYTGTARHIAIASYNIAGNAYADQYLDNLVISRIPNCIAPMRVQTTALTNVSADLAWQFSNAANYSIEYGVHGFTPGTGTTVTSTTRTVSLAGLTPYTQYDVYLTSVCSPAETSDTTFYTFTTLRGAPVTTYPYVCTFADTNEANAWEPVNGSQTNKWHVGTAAHYGTVDNMGLYISDNNGVSNQYTISSTSFTYVYRTFTMNVGSYNIGFNWQAQGESNYDYLRAWLAPADFEFTPGQTPDGGTYSYDYTSSNPAGWIPLDGGSKLNLQSSWQTANEDVAITTAGNYNLVFMWANDGSAGNNPPAAIDNVEVYINTCPAPVGVFASSAGATYIDLDWTDLAPAVSWQVEYGPSGYSRGSGTLLNVTSHPVNISGLDTLTPYDFYIRPICSGADTGRWSSPAALSTAMCDNAQVFALGSSASTGTSYYFPVNNYYNYTLTETIIDSAELNGPMDIEYIGYYYDYSSPSTAKANCTIYFQPTAKTVFTSSSDMVALDSATGVRVFTGSLNCTQGWNYFQLDTAYHYDGTGNLLVIVDDNSGDYDGSSYVFKTQSCTGYKTIHYYDDTDDPDVTDPSTFSTSKSYEQARPVMQLISCAGAGCRKPIIVSTTYDYESATITWSGNGTNYEVNIKETASDWPATDIPVVGNTYTFTGLMPATNYTFRVRQDCSADSLGYSEWALGNFITDSLPCLAPTNLSTTAVTNATATFDWTVRGTETAWDIHVWNTGNIDSIYTVTTRPATVGGFTAGLTYNASIRPLCGSAHNIVGDWGDTITFSTTICPTVTGLTVGNVTANGATLNWDADQMAVSWIVEYGFAGFDQGSGTVVPCSTNSFNATGLECETSYDFYVRAVCGTDWTSEHWTHVSLTTGDCSEACLAPTNVVATVDLNSVTVSWTPAEGNTAFEVEYGNRGFSHGNGTVVNTNEPSTVINGLEFNTQYDLYVRALCGADNYSPWTPVTTFTTGTQGIDNAEGVACTIFPNPTSSATTISVSGVNGKVKIEVVDMNGRTVASETLECSSDCRKTMDVDHLAQGAYFVRITGENVNMVKKLIVR